MATVAHPVHHVAPLTAAAVAVESWVLETILMVIVAVLSIAAFSVGYQVG